MNWLSSLLNIASRLYNFLQFLKNKFNPPQKSEVELVVDRFIALFKAHGIERTRIPSFLGPHYKLTLADMTDEKLAANLDDTVLFSVCELFGIRKEWLYTGREPIYEKLYFYKDMNRYVDFLSEITKKYEIVNVFAIKSKEDKLLKNGPDLPIVLIFEVPIGMQDEDQIHKFAISGDDWHWNYHRTRIQLKAMVWAAVQFKNVYVHGCELSKEDISLLIESRIFPGPLMKNLHWAAWHPDDYVVTIEKSPLAKDNSEALLARDYMSGFGWRQQLENACGDNPHSQLFN